MKFFQQTSFQSTVDDYFKLAEIQTDNLLRYIGAIFERNILSTEEATNNLIGLEREIKKLRTTLHDLRRGFQADYYKLVDAQKVEVSAYENETRRLKQLIQAKDLPDDQKSRDVLDLVSHRLSDKIAMTDSFDEINDDYQKKVPESLLAYFKTLQDTCKQVNDELSQQSGRLLLGVDKFYKEYQHNISPITRPFLSMVEQHAPELEFVEFEKLNEAAEICRVLEKSYDNAVSLKKSKQKSPSNTFKLALDNVVAIMQAQVDALVSGYSREATHSVKIRKNFDDAAQHVFKDYNELSKEMSLYLQSAGFANVLNNEKFKSAANVVYAVYTPKSFAKYAQQLYTAIESTLADYKSEVAPKAWDKKQIGQAEELLNSLKMHIESNERYAMSSRDNYHHEIEAHIERTYGGLLQQFQRARKVVKPDKLLGNLCKVTNEFIASVNTPGRSPGVRPGF